MRFGTVCCATATAILSALPLVQTFAAAQAAGEAMTFDVASVKPNTSDAPAAFRFPLGPGDAFAAGPIFSATNQPLIAYLRFAFKLGQGDLIGLPSWIYSDRFDVEARASGNPTKDQMRVMMQSLLRDRFRLVTGTVTKTKPVLYLILARDGMTGVKLQPSAGTCSAAPPARAGFELPPILCGTAGSVASAVAGRGRLAGRRVPISRLADLLTNPFTGIALVVVDHTNLTGEFDFDLEWSLERDPVTGALQDDRGPTLLQALSDDLGLRLEKGEGSVVELVVERVERPTPD